MRTIKVVSTRDPAGRIRGAGQLGAEGGRRHDSGSRGQVIATRGDAGNRSPKHAGKLRVRENKPLVVVYEQRDEREYEIPSGARLARREDGQRVEAGQKLTEGALNPHRILRILGREACQLYLLSEIQKVYRAQGVNINDKHFEVVIRKMLSQGADRPRGDTDFLPGELVDRLRAAGHQREAARGRQAPATAAPVLLGVTKAALSTDSFLSASSFQHTIKVLAGAAIEGKSRSAPGPEGERDHRQADPRRHGLPGGGGSGRRSGRAQHGR